MVAAALSASSRFFGFTAQSAMPRPALLTGVKWSTASIHFGIGGSTPAFGRLRHCRSAKTIRSAPSTIWNVLVPSADEPCVLAPAALATMRPTTPTAVSPTTQPTMNAGPFVRARGVTSMSTTPMIGIGLIPAAIAMGRIWPIACRMRVRPRARRPRRSVPAADETAGPLARVGVVAARLVARHDSREVARHRLQVALTAGREVGVHDRAAHREALEIDHVEVGALADLDRASVGEAVELRGAAGLLLDHELERDGLAARAVPRPVGQLRARAGTVADELHVRAGVGEPDDRHRVRDHLADRVEVAVHVAGAGQVHDVGAVALGEEVVERLDATDAAGRADRAEDAVGPGLVVDDLVEAEHEVGDVRHHLGEHLHRPRVVGRGVVL